MISPDVFVCENFRAGFLRQCQWPTKESMLYAQLLNKTPVGHRPLRSPADSVCLQVSKASRGLKQIVRRCFIALLLALSAPGAVPGIAKTGLFNMQLALAELHRLMLRCTVLLSAMAMVLHALKKSKLRLMKRSCLRSCSLTKQMAVSARSSQGQNRTRQADLRRQAPPLVRNESGSIIHSMSTSCCENANLSAKRWDVCAPLGWAQVRPEQCSCVCLPYVTTRARPWAYWQLILVDEAPP